MMMRHKNIFALFGKSEMNHRYFHQLLGKSPATRRINESRKSAVCRVTLRRKKASTHNVCEGSRNEPFRRVSRRFFSPRDSFEIKPVGVHARADRMTHV